MAFQFVDHERRGAEELIMSGSGGLALVAFDLSIPAFQFQSHARRIVIVQRNKRGQDEHRGTDNDALPCLISGMLINVLVEQEAGANEFLSGRRLDGIRAAKV